MSHRALFVLIAASGCATTTRGAAPHEMSAAQHEREAEAHARMAEAHEAQHDPGAGAERNRCDGRLASRTLADVCWTSVVNPTQAHLREAEVHRKQAADHRSGSSALRQAEAQACAGIAADERDMSPFEHSEDITRVEPLNVRAGGAKGQVGARMAGATVTFRAVKGMTAEWLQRTVDCHLARNAALGHVVPEMPHCPLVPNGVEAQVSSTGDGFAVAVSAKDPATAQEVLARARRSVAHRETTR